VPTVQFHTQGRSISLVGTVHDLSERQPHLAGQCTCLNCGYTWTGVAPVGVYELECGECGTMKGVWNNVVAGETYWECRCGCRHFTVSGVTQNCLCAHCGLPQVFS
jgi:hypothetical protein